MSILYIKKYFLTSIKCDVIFLPREVHEFPGDLINRLMFIVFTLEPNCSRNRKERFIMTKKLKRIFVGIMAAAICIVGSMSSISASAATYNLHYGANLPSSATVTKQIVGTYSSNPHASLTENCTTYSGCTNSNGSVAYASYRTYYVTHDGHRMGWLHDYKYHFGTQGSHTVSYSVSVPETATAYTVYELQNYRSLSSCRISGTAVS